MIFPLALLGFAATTLAQLRTPGTIEFTTGEQLATILDPNFHGVNIVVNTPSDVYVADYFACVRDQLNRTSTSITRTTSLALAAFIAAQALQGRDPFCLATQKVSPGSIATAGVLYGGYFGTSETPESPGSAFQVPSDRCDPTRFGTIDLDDGQRNAFLLLVRAPDAAVRFDMLRYASSVALAGYAYNYAVFSIDCTGTITIGPAPGVLMVEATSDFVYVSSAVDAASYGTPEITLKFVPAAGSCYFSTDMNALTCGPDNSLAVTCVPGFSVIGGICTVTPVTTSATSVRTSVALTSVATSAASGSSSSAPAMAPSSTSSTAAATEFVPFSSASSTSGSFSDAASSSADVSSPVRTSSAAFTSTSRTPSPSTASATPSTKIVDATASTSHSSAPESPPTSTATPMSPSMTTMSPATIPSTAIVNGTAITETSTSTAEPASSTVVNTPGPVRAGTPLVPSAPCSNDVADGVPFCLYVDAGRQAQRSEQVAAMNLRLLEEAREAESSRTELNVVQLTGQDAQFIANQAARATSSFLTSAQLAQTPQVCGTAVPTTCKNVINGGTVSCSLDACDYSCNSGANPLIFPTFVDCVDTQNDFNNCGAVGVICRDPYNGIGSTLCVQGNCAVQCPAGFSIRFFPTGLQYCAMI